MHPGCVTLWRQGDGHCDCCQTPDITEVLKQHLKSLEWGQGCVSCEGTVVPKELPGTHEEQERESRQNFSLSFIKDNHLSQAECSIRLPSSWQPSCHPCLQSLVPETHFPSKRNNTTVTCCPGFSPPFSSWLWVFIF